LRTHFFKLFFFFNLEEALHNDLLSSIKVKHILKLLFFFLLFTHGLSLLFDPDGVAISTSRALAGQLRLRILAQAPVLALVLTGTSA